jgi:hypothetical protein
MINLLPQSEKEKVRRGYAARVAIASGFIVFLLIAISVLLLLPAYAVLRWEQNNDDKSIADTSARIKTLESENAAGIAKTANDHIALAREEKTKEPKLTEMFKIIVGHINPKVTLGGISYDRAVAPSGGAETARVNLSGKAKDRDGYLAFLWALQKETSYFSQVTAPITNLIKDKDLSFQISLYAIQ